MLRLLNPDTMKWQAQIAVVDASEGLRCLNVFVAHRSLVGSQNPALQQGRDPVRPWHQI